MQTLCSPTPPLEYARDYYYIIILHLLDCPTLPRCVLLDPGLYPTFPMVCTTSPQKGTELKLDFLSNMV